ncbi:MAG: hypothetical protein JGK17_08020 [Microcoleus sp. PH2017_10_PVI_O_A]|uniref:hypothetical protein n=1 Tax=unclassified Microcoleus TaxID=2642155 RepID=UPI001DB616F7|nr:MULTISPECIES: hypothetical protein [unclassified Microcoleus]TAE83611.1 MAG: hypothetical protein EAZ83_08875 [Oscillatoriales cyanobacterium]MCC3405527.1 hypothetical protein [Microcoleus sp. PH2017_10_PVI_O_A]MCC3459554.1 hypothetical protein [Microcoleus sp. PH2017_11_PCY_U_A]MCC3478019.1 hypothetical protein [Microcoleus sp. PH2017_12_PCY_D_A]MCC3526639.1 hypothetical protein [Microcoleus sp. PH2017_21_RUC_O_A]
MFNPLITENRTEAEPALKSLPTIEQQWVGLLKNQVTVSSPKPFGCDSCNKKSGFDPLLGETVSSKKFEGYFRSKGGLVSQFSSIARPVTNRLRNEPIGGAGN